MKLVSLHKDQTMANVTAPLSRMLCYANLTLDSTRQHMTQSSDIVNIIVVTNMLSMQM